MGLDWHDYVEIDPRLLRPAEVNTLRGDATKARTCLDWQPTVAFAELVRMMVDADLQRVRAELTEKSADVIPPSPATGKGS